MGQASRTIDLSAPRQRPEKALRTHGRYTGNLVVFGEAGAVLAANSAYAPKDAAPGHVHLPKSTFSLYVATAATAGALLTGIVAVSLLSPISTENTELTVAKASVSPTPIVRATPTISSTDVANLGDANASSKAQQAEHAIELHRLNETIFQLEGEIGALTSETLELNAELLELELELVAVNDQSHSNTQTRTVYNFVNVPLGGSIESVPTPIAPVTTDGSTGQIAYSAEDGFRVNPNYIFEDNTEQQTRSIWTAEVRYPPVDSNNNRQ